MVSCYQCEKHENCPFKFYKDAITCLGFVPIKNFTKEEFEKKFQNGLDVVNTENV